MLRTDDLDYVLPDELVATTPAEPRDSARLMVVRRSEPERVEHRVIRELPEILARGDLLVLNSTRVLPARFTGIRADTKGSVEGLYLGPAPSQSEHEPRWHVLLKMRRMKPGVKIDLLSDESRPTDAWLTLLERTEGDGGWIVQVGCHSAPFASPATMLCGIGLTPLPPYIRAARKRRHLEIENERDRRWYQTVFADEPNDGQGSVAAPTAGLHFTPHLLDGLSDAGVNRAEVLLHVGMGTFKPIETEFVEQHPMHSEWCHVPAATGRAIDHTKSGGGRVIAVGTTAARTLESFDTIEGLASGCTKETRLLITPGCRWKFVDALLTNFHLPRTTLLAMVAAMLDRDPETALRRLKHIYELAVRERYRFYSYGDAMLILP